MRRAHVGVVALAALALLLLVALTDFAVVALDRDLERHAAVHLRPRHVQKQAHQMEPEERWSQGDFASGVPSTKQQQAQPQLEHSRFSERGFFDEVGKIAKNVVNTVKTTATHIVSNVVSSVKSVATNVFNKVKSAATSFVTGLAAGIGIKIASPPPPLTADQLFGHLANIFPPVPPLKPRPPPKVGRQFDPSYQNLDQPDLCPDKCNGRGRCLMDPTRLVSSGRVREHPYRCVCHPLYTGPACETRVDQYLRWFESNGTTPFPQCCQVCPSQFSNPQEYDSLPVYLNPFSASNCDPGLSPDSRPDDDGRAPCWRPLNAEPDNADLAASEESSSSSFIEFRAHPMRKELFHIDDADLLSFLETNGIDYAAVRRSLMELDAKTQMEWGFGGSVHIGGATASLSVSGGGGGGGGGFLSSIGNAVKKVASNVGHAISNGVNAVKRVASNIAGGIRNGISNVVSKVGGAIRNIGAKIKRTVTKWVTPNLRPTPTIPVLFNAGFDMANEFNQDRLKAAEQRVKASAAAITAEQKRKSYYESSSKSYEEQEEKALAQRLSYPVPKCCIHCDFDFWVEANSRPPRPRGAGNVNYIRALERQRIMERMGADAVMREMRRRELMREELEQKLRRASATSPFSLLEKASALNGPPLSRLMTTPTGQAQRNMQHTMRDRKAQEMAQDPEAEPDPSLHDCCVVCPIPSEDPQRVNIDAVREVNKRIDEANNRFGSFLRHGHEERTRPCCNACPSQFWLRTVSQDTDPFYGAETVSPERVVSDPTTGASSQSAINAAGQVPTQPSVNTP